MKAVELLIDVTGSVALPGPLHIAATAYLPDANRLKHPPVVIFASPGGGYTRGYYNLQFPGHTDYSEVEHHVEAGLIVVAYDHLGVGDSSLPDPGELTIEVIAAVNAAAVRSIGERIEQGTLSPDLPPLRGIVKIGAGQSMGGCLCIVMQGRHECFDAVAVLGYSGIHTVPPQREPVMQQGLIAATRALHRGTDIRKLSIAETTSPHTRDDMSYPHHWDDVPKDILAADTPDGFPFRRTENWPPPWRSATLPQCALIMLSPGCVAEEAAAIKVPLLLAMGERDVCPDPHAEPAAYKSSRDVSLYIVPGMAHMHNFATTRRRLWDRIVAWAMRVAG